MRLARAILVVLISLSVAALPAAAAGVRAHSPHTWLSNTQSDCCPQGEHCQDKAKGDCGKFATCVLKCSTVFPAMLTTSGTTRVLSALERSLTVSESPTSRSSDPPLPPPRI